MPLFLSVLASGGSRCCCPRAWPCSWCSMDPGVTPYGGRMCGEPWRPALSSASSLSSASQDQQWGRSAPRHQLHPDQDLGGRTSLMAQQVGTRLPMQGTQVQALVQEDPTCGGAAKPGYHSFWVWALEPESHKNWAHVPRVGAPQQEKPPQWEACTLQGRAAATCCNQRKPAQFSPVAHLCLTLYDPMDCSTPGFPVHHQLPELAQTHVHRVGDAIQPSHPLSSPSPPAFNLSQNQGLFQWVSSSHQVAKGLKFQLQHQPFQWTSRTDFP